MEAQIIQEYSSSRIFRLWDFHASHSHLLIRSNGGGPPKENIDLIFAGVEYVEVANILRGIKVGQSQEPAVVEALRQKSGVRRKSTGLKAFEIRSNDRTFYVFAGWLTVFINIAPPTESPLGIHCALGDETWRQYVRRYGKELCAVSSDAKPN